MNQTVTLLIGQMKIIASLMVIGFFAYRLKLFDTKLVDALSAIMTKLIMPLMLLTVIGSISRTELFSSFKFLVCSAIFYAIMVVCAKLISRAMGLKEPLRSLHSIVMSLGNSGFIGIPLIISIFPETAGIAAASFSLVEATLYWVIGPLLINNDAEKKEISFKRLLTPLTVSIGMGFIIVVCNFNFTGNVLWDTMKDVGATSKYFASIYIGMNIGRMGMERLTKNMLSALAAPIKLIVFPVLAYFVFGKTGIFTGDLLVMFIILFSTPAGMALPILAQLRGVDSEYPSAGCMISTILCLFTMPFVIWLIGII